MENNVMCSEGITKLAKAMLEVQKVINPACKDKLNNFTNSKYATLNSVVEACGETLIDAGIWVIQYPVPVDGGNGHLLGLVTKLVHVESGEWQSSLLVMPLPKNDPQGYGSALTYARRYGLSSLVGIVTEDDDAHNACEGARMVTHEGQNKGKLDTQKHSLRGGNSSKSANNTNSSENSEIEINCGRPAALPHIDGISYNEVTAQDGSFYLTATGATRNKSPMLKEAGFHWDASRKTWWRHLNQMTA